MDARSGTSRERVEAEPLPRDFPVPELGKLSACVVGQEVRIGWVGGGGHPVSPTVVRYGATTREGSFDADCERVKDGSRAT